MDVQWPQALRLTIFSSLLSTLLALVITALLATLHYPSALWNMFQRRLPLLLSVPHAAFAIGLFFLISPSGWLARGIGLFFEWSSPPDWVTVQDSYGLSLTLALAIKESWFLLWVLAGILGEQTVSRQLVIGRSLGYNRTQIWMMILWPQVLPRLFWPLMAVFAYGLSVVDMAIILGPSTPPTLAVLVMNWIIDPDPIIQARGHAASLVLLALMLIFVIVSRSLLMARSRMSPYPNGQRKLASNGHWFKLHTFLLFTGYAVVLVLVLWSVAGTWFFPNLLPDNFTINSWRLANWNPFFTTLCLASVVCLLSLPLALVWLEWGPRHLDQLLYLPLIIPALPLMGGLYAALLFWELQGSFLALVWSHFLWVMPYMVLTLIGPYRAFDVRLMTTAHTLGFSTWRACFAVKWPCLIRPILFAMAVGFAVSVAQYLPTLLAGAGRFETLTTEAVTLSSGGNRTMLAVQSVMQVALPTSVYLAAIELSKFLGKHRKGLR